MKIPCSNCNQRLEIPEELAGQTIQCPACNASLAVPSLAAPPSVTPQAEVATPQVASTKKSKLPIPKWAIASIAGIAAVVVVLIMFFPDDSNGILPSEPTVAKTDEESQRLTTKAKAPDISLFMAVRTRGGIKAVKQHIAAGTDVNAKNERGSTPLHGAASFGHKEIIELLISGGADVNAKRENIDSFTPLHAAASFDHKEIAELLIDNGADVNAKNDNGDTALHQSASFGHKEIAELLIAAGADVNAKIESGLFKGETPLDAAEPLEDDSPEDKTNKKEIADLLRKHGGKKGEELK